MSDGRCYFDDYDSGDMDRFYGNGGERSEYCDCDWCRPAQTDAGKALFCGQGGAPTKLPLWVLPNPTPVRLFQFR